MRRNSFTCMLTVVWCVLAASPFAGAQQQSWVGYVTDTHCGTNCQVTKNMTPDLKMHQAMREEGFEIRIGVWQ